MRILALQLKRIGDLILTTPALALLKEKMPKAEITLVVADNCAQLLPGIAVVNRSLVYGRNRSNRKLWWKFGLSSYDVCLDFTGTDRSALISLLSKAGKRVAYSSVRKSSGRALFYNRFAESPVRDFHT